MPIASVNPATGETVKVFTPHTDAELEQRLTRAARAFERWRRVPLAERGAMLVRAADLYEERREALAALIGKAGFPPLLLNPVNFEALYLQRLQQEQQGTTQH